MKNIVVAIEFDEELSDIVDFTSLLLKDWESEVHVVHVYEPNCKLVEYAPHMVDAISSYEDHLQEQASSVRGIVKKLIDNGIRSHGYMKPINRNVADSILEFCSEKDADLLVVGSHHSGRMERLILGSVAERVIRQANLPVVAVPRTPADS